MPFKALFPRSLPRRRFLHIGHGWTPLTTIGAGPHERLQNLVGVFSHLEEMPQQHGGTVYRQMTVVSSAKTASKKLFKQKTPLFALDFNTKMVFIKGKFCFDRVHVHLSR